MRAWQVAVKKWLRNSATATVFLAIIACAAVAALYSAQPRVEHARYRLRDEWQSFDHPDGQNAPAGTVVIDFDLVLSPLAGTTFIVHPSSCARLSVNNARVNGRFCNYLGVPIDLSPYLHSGVNRMRAEVEHGGGLLRFVLVPSLLGPSLPLAIGLALAVLGLIVQFLPADARDARLFAAPAVCGVLLRCVYAASTPYFVRAWDWDGHLEYITHVAEYWTIPSAASGWETYQPPLYYFAAAVWAKAWPTTEPSTGALQGLSVLLSVGAMFAGFWIARLLFPTLSERRERLIFAWVIAAFPGLVFFGSRLSNDTLLTTISLLCVALLILWWRLPSMKRWCALCVVLGLGVLTKMSIVPLLLTAVVCLVLHPGMDARRKTVIALTGAAVLMAVAGWLFVLRFAIEDRAILVFVQTGDAMKADNSARNLLTFNPYWVLRRPFNWNWNDDYRRQIFWEYLLKSSFVGEWVHHPIAAWPLRLLLAGSMVGVLFAATGLAKDWWHDRHGVLPIVVLIIASLATIFGYRLIGNIWCQDFRFIPFILPALLYGALRAMSALPRPLARATTVGVGALVALSAAFILLVASRGTLHP
jgi:Dolichyl-phosphate-mannose-protein mannosyltransferase